MIPQRNATQRNATQRNATQRNALLKKRNPVSIKSSVPAKKIQNFSIILGTFYFWRFNMKRISIALIIFSLFVFAGCRRGELRQKREADTQACEYAKKVNDIKVWENYIKKFPKGTCAFIAESELTKHGIPISEPDKNSKTTKPKNTKKTKYPKGRARHHK